MQVDTSTSHDGLSISSCAESCAIEIRLLMATNVFRWSGKWSKFRVLPILFWQPHLTYAQSLPHLYQKLSGLCCLNSLPFLLTSFAPLFFLSYRLFHINHATIFGACSHGSRANYEQFFIGIVKTQKRDRKETSCLRSRQRNFFLGESLLNGAGLNWDMNLPFARVCDFMFFAIG
jgi:hypothetical protein